MVRLMAENITIGLSCFLLVTASTVAPRTPVNHTAKIIHPSSYKLYINYLHSAPQRPHHSRNFHQNSNNPKNLEVVEGTHGFVVLVGEDTESIVVMGEIGEEMLLRQQLGIAQDR